MNTLRFNTAVKKLYVAFHNNTLNPEDCKQCAVGNILDHNDNWQYFTNLHGSLKLSYIGLVHQNLGRQFNGFSPFELLRIESAFLKGVGYKGINKGYCHKPHNFKNKDNLFRGLCAVISELCKLDGIDDLMDYSTLFSYNTTDNPKELATL